MLESAEILSHERHAGEQFVLRLRAEQIAARARPGCFVHLRCDAALPLRRPMSVMRARPQTGELDILYKVHGRGTRLLAARQAGERLSVLGPMGTVFKLRGYRSRPLLIGGGVGIPPMIFLAEHLQHSGEAVSPLVLMGSELPFPFRTRPSRIMVPGVPPEVIATMPLLDDWGIACRLASLQDYTGCYNGLVTSLARAWLDTFSADRRGEVEVFACGPKPMLRAVAALAESYGLDCQISLEEYMACAVGGCAGCAVAVMTPAGRAMHRVCVEGPVFDARRVLFSD